jgi:CHAT domain-containing protein
VRLARDLLRGAHPSQEIPEVVGELYDLLITPILSAGILDPSTRLLIVPHGALGALPFAALWNRRTGRFLIEDHELGYLPTVAAVLAPPATTQFTLKSIEVFAPLPDSLPGTASEARAIRQLVPSAELRLGRSSSEPGVRQALESGRSVHLASHGIHNPQNPLFSRIIVGSGRAHGPMDDGRLEAHEILGLATTSPLVFLSGCETGLGSAGEDPFATTSDEGSLSQAFLFAGAGQVVATLWPVSDIGATDLAERFYRHLRAGLEPGQSLTLAQRELLATSKGFAWAAYTISGAVGRKSGASVRTTGNTP